MGSYPRKRMRGFAYNAAHQIETSYSHIVATMAHFGLDELHANVLTCTFVDERFNLARNCNVLNIARRTLIKNFGAQLIGTAVHHIDATIKRPPAGLEENAHMNVTVAIFLNDKTVVEQSCAFK